MIYRLLIGGVCLLMVFSACQLKEGCLDAGATNFDPSADKDCCCTYPQLSLRVSHFAGVDELSYDSTHLDAIGTGFVIAGTNFYLSAVELVREDGATVMVTDTVGLSFEGEDRPIARDDYLLINKDLRLYPVGTIDEFGDFVKLRFVVGLDSLANAALSDGFEAGHPLNTVTGMHTGSTADGYFFNKMDIIIDRDEASTPFYIQSNENRVTIELDYPVFIKPAFDAELSININYLQFFEGIDFLNDDAATVRQKIVGNTANAFSVP